MSFEIGAKIIQILNNYGHEAYFVGGAVRDSLIGRPISDIDIATAAPPEKVIKIFPKTIPVGFEHGTVIVRMDNQSFEVTTFRRDGKYQDFRHPSSVDFITSIEEDLKRRDFTINAMAMTMERQIIDPFGGRKDLQKQLIKTVGNSDERFKEDPLRMMRAIRFLSMLGFTLDENTKTSIGKNRDLLANIAIERITIEFEKLLQGKFLSKAIGALIDTSLYQYLPGMTSAHNLEPFLHFTFPVNSTKLDRWSLLCYLLKIPDIHQFLKKWKLPNQEIKKIAALFYLLHSKNLYDVDQWFVYKEGYEKSLSFCMLMDILLDKSGHMEEVKRIYKELPIKNRGEMLVNGHDLITWLNRKPGPWIELLLEKIEKVIITGQLKNDHQAIKEWVLWMNQSEAD